MSDRPDLREALAALGQPGGAADEPQPGLAGPELDAAPSRAKRKRLLLIGAAVLAVVLVVGYWQRQPLLQALERVPLVGSFVREQRLAREAAPTPEQLALAQREREVAERERVVQEAEAALLEREQQLELQEQALAAREAELAAAEEAFAASLPGPGIDELVDIYRNMKPDAAADRIARLEDLTALTILKQVDRQQAARILAAMEAGRAAALSEVLAQHGTDP